MLCVSTSSNLSLPIRERETEYYPNGAVRKVKSALGVQFVKAVDIPDFAKEAVSKMAGFGLGVGQEEDPFSLCGIFDSVIAAEQNNWSEEDRLEVEAALERVAGLTFVIVDKPKAQKPWEKYDEIDGPEDEAAFEISKIISLTGADPRMVKAYELENFARPLVLEALDRLIDEDEQDTIGVIQA